MKRILYFCLLSILCARSVADTIITLIPELSLNSDGKAIIVNAEPYCSDATYIYIDTTTDTGKTMYSMALSAYAANKEIHFQTGCTCGTSCSSNPQVQVFKMCSKLTGSLCR
ncbi:hypothetical protein FKG94_20285 [Exilibacterium tricleocarpae]|uniref:Uncharacterized protein n=1 Tax=Exilibacterium tricleocarpae TaxID=2591008 RepID=A0A545T0C2_9GAMM|nr:hypothetical protein [Exilibacterium tricleocarpae]TQV70673.1 hypothetical protein FKG94_20285 [Exilibacterium tricleocarpae]